MKRMKWRLLCWLVLYLVFHNITCMGNTSCNRDRKNSHPSRNDQNSVSDKRQGSGRCKPSSGRKAAILDTRCCMEEINSILEKGTGRNTIDAMRNLERMLEDTEVNGTTPISIKRLVAILHRPNGPFRGLEINANETKAMSAMAVNNSKVRIQLPRELGVGSDNTIVFCMLTWPETNGTIWEAPGEIYESRLIGLSVQGKNVSGLQERVNITMNLILKENETRRPMCAFFNFSTQKYSSYGCETLWDNSQDHVTCSCDHLTYFGVLMVSANISPEDQQILTFITLTGCSISLFALVLTVLLFITNKTIRTDVSMKVHINLAIALILLNVHFLPSHTVAELSSPGLCLYVALSLHFSLLATFSWMAVEGFHLYLLLIRVFNIYVRRYLLKISLVGWGVPAVIVSLVAIIDTDTYGRVPLDLSNSNSTAICYIRNDMVKNVTTVGVFSLVFLFNMIMLGVMVQRVLSLRHSKEFGQRNHDRAKREIFTLLGITVLLGIPWGLVFFSFGYLTTAGLYPFCILNSLQGFFIFLWFVMSLRKIGKSAETSGVTHSINS
ncbi:adhesion G-protein coupled receptor G1-like isoform X1 [Acanthopagrus latus]|uniref:adhesion G-protein coupled receptor G1-like isoform X1 n=1 Tax=Acanthopagrus latus TaxID=8177 RepID=UPI00187BCF76|nr:adhesion G-protein coupled receptor G1-like isoform X1 [Acanthopagrus latus]XP_036951583.1 adhesion G-protein coupled receptor G1-like isoform X1 [Acanthopagrus latus]